MSKARMPRTARVASRSDVATAVDAIRRVLRALRRAAGQAQVSTGMSAAQLFVLRALEDGEPASLTELAERTMTDRTSVAAVLARLIDAGFATRQVDDGDRRRAAISMTRTGRAALKHAPVAPTALLVAGLEGLSRAEQRALARGLTALSQAMGLDEEKPVMLFEDEPGTAADDDR
jgi:DNA-binding MarR family transcriptional regulator